MDFFILVGPPRRAFTSSIYIYICTYRKIRLYIGCTDFAQLLLVLLVGAHGETRDVVCLTIRIVSLLTLYRCSATFAGALGGRPWGSPEPLLSYYLLVFVSGGRMMGSSRKLLVLLAGTCEDTLNFVCLSTRVRAGRPDSEIASDRKRRIVCL